MVFWTDVSKFYVRALYPFEFRLVKSGKVSLVKYEAELKLCVSKIKKNSVFRWEECQVFCGLVFEREVSLEYPISGFNLGHFAIPNP